MNGVKAAKTAAATSAATGFSTLPPISTIVTLSRAAMAALFSAFCCTVGPDDTEADLDRSNNIQQHLSVAAHGCVGSMLGQQKYTHAFPYRVRQCG
eukprot:SAG31_NODE_5956_length_2242_cov_1.588894_1_plen_96_part_00